MSTVMFLPRLFAEQVTEQVAMISIGDPGQILPAFATYHAHLLRLTFHDIEEDLGPEYQQFSYQDALKVLRFLSQVPEQEVVVHCEAGISRSVAIAKFMIETLGYQQRLHPLAYSAMDRYNTDVYRQLRLAHLDLLSTTHELLSAV